MLVAIDTSTQFASLALHDGHLVRYEATWQAGRRHTVHLPARLAAALDDLGASPNALSAVAVTLGPGSFTGLRVGMAVAKGLVLGRGLDLVGIPTLDVVARAQGQDERPLIAVLQAGRGRICAAVYRWVEGWQLEDGPWLATWTTLVERLDQPVLVCGEIDAKGAEVLAQHDTVAAMLSPAHSLRRAGFLAEQAWERLRHGHTDDPDLLVPIYLHEQV